jgi:hypothetical protein
MSTRIQCSRLIPVSSGPPDWSKINWSGVFVSSDGSFTCTAPTRFEYYFRRWIDNYVGDGFGFSVSSPGLLGNYSFVYANGWLPYTGPAGSAYVRVTGAKLVGIGRTEIPNGPNYDAPGNYPDSDTMFSWPEMVGGGFAFFIHAEATGCAYTVNNGYPLYSPTPYDIASEAPSSVSLQFQFHN